MHSGHFPRLAGLAGAVVVLGGLSACSSPDAPAADANAAAGCPLTVADGWVKATTESMTAGFGTLVNSGSTEVKVTGASSPAAGMVELHEVVDDNGTMTMRRDADGFAVPGGGSLRLEPGGAHLMLMDLAAPLRAGRQVTFTLTCGDDATAQFTAQVKDFQGADERYQGSAPTS